MLYASSQLSTVEMVREESLGRDEIIIRNEAVGVDPLDAELLQMHVKGFPASGTPMLGQSVAGIVVGVGAGVVRFHMGQRVMAHCHALKSQDQRNSGLRPNTVALASLTASIPNDLSYSAAATLPLAISTVAAALFEKTHLNLELPSQKHARPRGTLLILDDATSMGASAIQLAVVSGLRVVAIAASRDHEAIGQMGVDIVIDSEGPSVVEQVATALVHDTLIGILDTVSSRTSAGLISDLLRWKRTMPRVCCVQALPPEIADFHYTVAIALSLLRPLHALVRDEIWGQYIPGALQLGTFRQRSDPTVVGKGLQTLPSAFEALQWPSQDQCPKTHAVVLL